MAGQVHHVGSMAELQSVFSSNTYVAIDFYADWCPPCKQIGPIFESLGKSNTVPGQLAFAKVNTDHAQDIAMTYRITAMPTFMFFKEGKQVAVHGKPMIQGADVRGLSAAIEKLGGLAKKRASS